MLAFFPFGVSGRIRINVSSTTGPIIARIEDMLDAASASTVTTNGTEVDFTAALFRAVGNWNILVTFGSGKIWLEPEPTSVTVRYRLSTMQLLLVATAMVALFALFATFTSTNNAFPLQTAATAFAVGWGWLFGMNYLIGMIRFPLWLERGLKRGIVRNKQGADAGG